MSYLVLSRKWRPRLFADIIGQNHVTDTLFNAIKLNKISHAFLFSGPRGVGKTTTARVLAMNVNDIDSCRNCIDIIELDGASNRGIDEIRQINESVQYLPSSVKYKVYIIDEVHMLTEQAFNALLKTLEEPPPHVIFILATTDPHKIPQTILSRTQRYDFKRLSDENITDRMKFVLDEEKIKYDDNALKIICEYSDGSMRDALSILDKIITYDKEIIDSIIVKQVIGVVDTKKIKLIFNNIINKELNLIIKNLNIIFDMGISPNQFISGLNKFLNNLMLIILNCKSDIDEDISSLSLNINTEINHLDVLRMLNQTLLFENNLKKTINPYLSTEVFLLKLANVESSVTINDIKEDNIVFNVETKDVLDNNKENQKNIAIPKNLNSDNINLDQVNSNWNDIIDDISNKSKKLSACMNDISIKKINTEIIVLCLNEKNDFAKDVILSESKLIIKSINKILKSNFDFKIDVIDGEITEEMDAEKIEDHPLLQSTIESFNGKLI